jgi:predicted dehydrogenase
MDALRLAFAGAGAVVATRYLPAARRCPDVQLAAIADPNLARARALASRHGIRRVAADFSELADGVDAVVIALPNFLHAPAAVAFVGRGVHVLVEKPMATTAADAERMIEAARVGGAVLDAGLVLRRTSGARWIRRALARGAFGRVNRLDVEYGGVFAWRPASGFLFRREHAGGGVLIDLGSHMLDLMTWWLGPATVLEYRDDSLGGVEAECTALLSFDGQPGSVHGALTLSRLRAMSNVVRIVTEQGTVSWDILADSLRVEQGAGLERALADVEPSRPLVEMFAEELRAFARAAAEKGRPAVNAEAAVTVLRLIERAYAKREPLDFPWGAPGPRVPAQPLM